MFLFFLVIFVVVFSVYFFVSGWVCGWIEEKKIGAANNSKSVIYTENKPEWGIPFNGGR